MSKNKVSIALSAQSALVWLAALSLSLPLTAGLQAETLAQASSQSSTGSPTWWKDAETAAQNNLPSNNSSNSGGANSSSGGATPPDSTSGSSSGATAGSTAGVGVGAGSSVPEEIPMVSPVPAASKSPAASTPKTALTPRPSIQQTPVRKPSAMLQGRIEEISGNGATLPLKLTELKPLLDPRANPPLKANIRQQQLRSQVASFPMDWRGTWSGQLKIHGVQFDRIRWDFDPEEANKEQQLLKPGTTGDVSFNFNQEGGRIALEPSQVVFTATMDSSQYAGTMDKMFGSQGNPFGSMMNPQVAAAMFKNVPYMFAMHLGNISQGTGVTGNQLNSRVMKNEVKQLSQGVVEQTVVTYDNDHNPKTGKTRNSFSESVLRFTRLNSTQLYVQAATVNYRQDGKFENKYLLYGTVNRGQASNPMSGFGGMVMPGQGGGMGGMGGLGGLDQLMRQLQGR